MDLSGKRFGKLVAVKKSIADRANRRYYECLCDCGRIKEVRQDKLSSGETKSCGCLRKTHGHTSGGRSKLYERWYSMLARCNNKNRHNYEHYGAKGIMVCERWKSFQNFISDMGEPPVDENGKTYHLDRIDPNGDYCPENCRWLPEKENKRRAQLDRWNKNE